MTSAPTAEVDYGKRTLPQALDEYSRSDPGRLFAAIPRSPDLSDGFMDITCADMARCVDYMAHWITYKKGVSLTYETLGYLGIPDLRGAIMFLAAVKCGYKVLFLSIRNLSATNISLLQQTYCYQLLYAEEVSPLVRQLHAIQPSLIGDEIPAFREMLYSTPKLYQYNERFDTHSRREVAIMHSSGSTGHPKPIFLTHGSFAVLDNQRNLPSTPGRENQDFSSWNTWGRFYSVLPHYHLAGFIALVVGPLFSSAFPVLGPPLMPPSVYLIKEIRSHQNIRVLYLPPATIENLFLEPGGLDVFRGLAHLVFTGGPLSLGIAERIRQVTDIINFYGSTEILCLPHLAPGPEDWSWVEWNPYMNVQMEKTGDQEQTFELVVSVDKKTKDFIGLYHSLPGTTRYHTRDLFSPHPTKPNLWRYYGRKDDIIVLSGAHTLNAVPIEMALQNISLLTGALVVGQGRPQPALMVELALNVDVARERILDLVWPLVKEANRLAPVQGKILRSRILVANPEKPFARASKGTIVRKLTEQLYELELDHLYSQDRVANPDVGFPLTPSTEKTFKMEDVARFVHDILSQCFLASTEAGSRKDLLSHGLDYLQIGEIVARLRFGLQIVLPTADVSWISPRMIYLNSTVQGITTAVYKFLTLKGVPSQDNNDVRFISMQAMVKKHTSGLIARAAIPQPPLLFPKHIALIGYEGYFGSHLLLSLLESPWVSKIYCMDTYPASPPPVAASHPAAFKAAYLPIDISLPNLSLDHNLCKILIDDVDVILYNAWKPDFASPLEAFETPFICGLRHVIDWSVTSIRRPRIVFISSACAARNEMHVKPDDALYMESPIDNPGSALRRGYSEGKWVCERMLEIACQRSAVPVDILRIGQMGGPADLRKGLWAEQEWLRSLIRASRVMGIVPERVVMADWAPVDQLAEMVREVVDTKDGGQDQEPRVFNLVHPRPKPWDIVVRTLRERFRMNLRTVSLSEWVGELERRGKEGDMDVMETGALGFLEAYRVFGDGMGYHWSPADRKRAAAASRVDFEPITVDLLEAWLWGWKL